MAINIFLSTHDRKEVLQIPVVPPQIAISESSNDIIIDTVGQGEISLPGLAKLNTMSWESHFPIDVRSYSRNTSIFGWDYYKKLDNWRKTRTPIRVIVTDTPINELFLISSLTPSINRGVADVYYAIGLTGFRFTNLNKEKV